MLPFPTTEDSLVTAVSSTSFPVPAPRYRAHRHPSSFPPLLPPDAEIFGLLHYRPGVRKISGKEEAKKRCNLSGTSVDGRGWRHFPYGKKGTRRPLFRLALPIVSGIRMYPSQQSIRNPATKPGASRLGPIIVESVIIIPPTVTSPDAA